MKNNLKQKNIPNGWLEYKLKDVVKVNQGLQIPISERFKDPAPNRKIYITIQYLNGGSATEYIQGYSDSVSCGTEDVLMTRTGNTGIVVTGAEGVFHNNFFKINTFEDLINRKFLIYFLRLRKTQFKILSLAGTGTIPDLNHGDFYSIKLALPSINEQERIVTVLQTWDQAIEKLEKKIELKKKIKKGLMQQLLPGDVRLPGFTDEWNSFQLDEISEFKKGKGLSWEKVSQDGNNRCILYGELYTTYSEIILNVKSRTDSEDGTLSKEGDILIPASTTTNALDLAIASCLMESGVRLGGDINIMRKKYDYDPRFMALYLSHVKKHDLARLAQGVTIIHLYSSDFKKMKITIPDKEEQTKIADVIVEVEREIQILMEKHHLMRRQKKFILNKLITGEIRTPENLEVN